MLIPSPRHTKADLACWAEYVAADLVAWKELERSGKIERAMDAIRVFRDRHDGRVYCSVSFGKDSVVTADLCRRVDPAIPLCHLSESNASPDAPLVWAALRDRWSDAAWHFEPCDYGDYHRRGMPLHDQVRDLQPPWDHAIARVSARYGMAIFGIRQSESRVRRFRIARHGLECATTLAPIGRWTNSDVFAYLEGRGLPAHPAYACLGGGRWPRNQVRVAAIGNPSGRAMGRGVWEAEYYPDMTRMVLGSG